MAEPQPHPTAEPPPSPDELFDAFLSAGMTAEQAYRVTRSLEATVTRTVTEALQAFEERMDGRFAQVDSRFEQVDARLAMVLHELRSDREARKRERQADLAAREREREADLAARAAEAEARKGEREADLAAREAEAEARKSEREADLAARAADAEARKREREADLAIRTSTDRSIRVLQWMLGVLIALVITSIGLTYQVLTS